MTLFFRGRARFAVLALAALAVPAASQEVAPLPADTATQSLPAPQHLQTGDETPWIYRGSDVPRDRDWLFGEMPNGLRYAVRRNNVPPGQVAIRVRIDAGSLHEAEDERGFAHLLEHMTFRESAYLGPGEAIRRWEQLGASFGSDTNAETSPTHTAYKLDLPGATPASLAESVKLLSGMIREPVLSAGNLAADLPIVLAEKRERGGAQLRVAEASRGTLFAGQPLATRSPIGTVETLTGASAADVQAFHARWYRPENTVIAIAGDADPMRMASLIEEWFGDWESEGAPVSAPSFGDPVPPAGADPANPVGETTVLIEPDLPRGLTVAWLRPWRPVNDTVVYNEGLLMDALSLALINRRLEARARGGGSYLYAQVQQDDVSRSADATFLSLAPLGADWRAALGDVRGVIADALASSASQDEIERELAEFEIAFRSSVEQERVQAGAQLADTIVQAVDIREAVAAPGTVLEVFNSMRAKLTPELLFERTRALFDGDVVRGIYITPESGEADAGALRAALAAPATADDEARIGGETIAFDELPPIGPPGEIVATRPLGVLDVEEVTLSNGVKALLWANTGEPGRVTVRARFGAGRRGFDADSAPYASLGEAALVASGLGELGQDEIDRLATGRRLGFDFAIEESHFAFSAQTRADDLADQLYLFAAKLAMPRWDENPVLRAQAAAQIAHGGYATSPGGVLQRDLDTLLRAGDPRYATPDPETIAATTPDGFRAVWEPLLRQGPVEVIVFGDFDTADARAALERTFGALAPRTPIPADVADRGVTLARGGDGVEVLRHRGDAEQAAAVIAWPTGGGRDEVRASRRIEVLTRLFGNRLLDEMRERSGASYAPQAASDWPLELDSGGTIRAVAQLRPADVPVFFDVAEAIARDLAETPVPAEELQRVTGPLEQLVRRASTGNGFWLYQLDGATLDPRVVATLPGLVGDYTRVTPAELQALAARYLASEQPWKLAVLPEGADGL